MKFSSLPFLLAATAAAATHQDESSSHQEIATLTNTSVTNGSAAAIAPSGDSESPGWFRNGTKGNNTAFHEDVFVFPHEDDGSRRAPPGLGHLAALMGATVLTSTAFTGSSSRSIDEDNVIGTSAQRDRAASSPDSDSEETVHA